MAERTNDANRLSNIASVARACDCDGARAEELLNRAGNVVSRAIKLQRTLTKYQDKVDSKSSISSPPILQPVGQYILPVNRYIPGTNTSFTEILSGAREHAKLRPAGHGDQPTRMDSLFNSKPAPQKTSAPAVHLPHHEVTLSQRAGSWDFILPVVTPTTNIHTPDFVSHEQRFNLRELVAHMQYGADVKVLQRYLQQFEQAVVSQHINEPVEGFPAIFYAVETNKGEILRLFAFYGADVSSVHLQSRAPLLAFAIVHGAHAQCDTTQIVATLLSLRASPGVIPAAFYSPYFHDFPDEGPGPGSLTDLSPDQQAWCTGVVHQQLAQSCSLSQRYYLERAAKTDKPTTRQRQIA